MKRLLPVIAVSIALGSCAHLARKGGPLRLGTGDSGKTVAVAVGQVITVRLAWNPSTGYRWQTVSEPDARVLIVEDTGYDRPTAKAPGGAGQAWWKLRATGSGSTSIVLRYVQPWEPAKDAQQFSLTVNVK